MSLFGVLSLIFVCRLSQIGPNILAVVKAGDLAGSSI